MVNGMGVRGGRAQPGGQAGHKCSPSQIFLIFLIPITLV